MEKTIHTENDAWEVFVKAYDPLNPGSHDPRDTFRIERETGCWVFRWADRATTPVGMTPFIVTDDGKVMTVGSPSLMKPMLAEIAENTEK